MFLGRIKAKGFKSLLDMDVPPRQAVTVVVGENNAGVHELWSLDRRRP
ncbi:hypothetical protein GCM10010272_42620 [Streptomyces lateritius]|nr:hypothetical protein GCM10010272_42620 [Streptomyces lateritius]